MSTPPFPQQGGIWAQVSDRDLFDPTKYGAFAATMGIDLSTIAGRILFGRRMILNTSSDDVAQITAPPCAFALCGSSLFAAAGLANVGYLFKNNGLLSGTFAIDQSTNISSSMTTGSGLNDMSSTPTGGPSGASHVYVVTISTTSTPDKFNVTKDGSTILSGISITGSPQTIDTGVVITFAATTGHTLANAWTVNLACAPVTIDSTTSDMIFAADVLTVSYIANNNVYIQQKSGNQPWGMPILIEADVVGYPHMLHFYGGRIYVTNSQSKINSVSSAGSVATVGANTLLLNGITTDFANIITKIFTSASKNWVLCINANGGPGNVYEWDGVSTSYQIQHPLTSAGALAGCNFHDVPYFMDAEGYLQAWNGYTFKPVASLYRKHKKLLYNPVSLVNNRFIHPNGMSVVDEKIRMLIDTRNNDNTLSVEEYLPAGVYEFDPNNPARGIYNINPISIAHVGDTISDYGQIRLPGVGALKSLNLPSTSASRNGSFLVGSGFYGDATTIKYGIFYDDLNDTLQKAGSFIMLKIDSLGTKDIMKFLRMFYKYLINSTDKYVLKYIYQDSEPVEGTITWVNTQQFTVPNSQVNVWNYYTVGNAKSGEVEVMQGIGAGHCAHITNAVLAAGIWTVSVDEVFTGATTTTAQARFKNWIWLGEANQGQGKIDIKVSPDISRSFFIFKLFALVTGRAEIERIVPDSEVGIPSNINQSM